MSDDVRTYTCTMSNGQTLTIQAPSLPAAMARANREGVGHLVIKWVTPMGVTFTTHNREL